MWAQQENAPQTNAQQGPSLPKWLLDNTQHHNLAHCSTSRRGPAQTQTATDTSRKIQSAADPRCCNGRNIDAATNHRAHKSPSPTPPSGNECISHQHHLIYHHLATTSALKLRQSANCFDSQTTQHRLFHDAEVSCDMCDMVFFCCCCCCWRQK